MKKFPIKILNGFIFCCFMYSLSFGQIFSKLTESSVVEDASNFRSASWVDYNNDNYIDLFVTTWRGFTNYLFKNNGDGTFSRILSGDIVNDTGSSYGGIWGDFNNDGNIDLFIPNFNSERNYFYINNGDHSFTKLLDGELVTEIASSRSACWGDINGDSYLDLFVVNGGDDNNSFYVNNQNETFIKVTTGIIVEDGGNSFSSTWVDYDNDTDLDLFVANRDQNNFLYENNGNGSFTKQIGSSITNDGGISNSGSWGDYNNDGYLDLFVANGDQFNSTENFLYENNGDGNFTKQVNVGEIVNSKNNSWDSSWGDYDNDGDLDLFIANYNLDESNELYSNNGNGSFTKVNSGLIDSDKSYSRSCIWGDYDNDGDLDIFISNGSENDLRQNFLYINNSNSNNWINLKCIGTLSNYSAIGTRIKLKAIINGKSYWQYRSITSQTGNRSQNSLNVEFGLGNASIIDSIVVSWPSGIIQTLTNIEVNQILPITEDLEIIAQNVNDKIDVQTQFTFYNRIAHQFQFDLRIQNTSVGVFYPPLFVQFVTLESDPAGHKIKIENSDGGGHGVGSFYDYSNLLGINNQLEPAEFTDYKTWIFSDPDDVNFFFSANILASNKPPALNKQSLNTYSSTLKFYADIKNQTVTEFNPSKFALKQNFPNPFSPMTKIEFSLPKPEKVRIEIFDILGRSVNLLVNKQVQIGYHSIEFVPKNLPNGIYFYKMQAGKFIALKKMLLIK